VIPTFLWRGIRGQEPKVITHNGPTARCCSVCQARRPDTRSGDTSNRRPMRQNRYPFKDYAHVKYAGLPVESALSQQVVESIDSPFQPFVMRSFESVTSCFSPRALCRSTLVGGWTGRFRQPPVSKTFGAQSSWPGLSVLAEAGQLIIRQSSCRLSVAADGRVAGSGLIAKAENEPPGQSGDFDVSRIGRCRHTWFQPTVPDRSALPLLIADSARLSYP
jgi:hypothetical protein